MTANELATSALPLCRRVHRRYSRGLSDYHKDLVWDQITDRLMYALAKWNPRRVEWKKWVSYCVYRAAVRKANSLWQIQWKWTQW